MNSKEISIALGLSSPCRISNVHFELIFNSERELCIYLDFECGFTFLTRSGNYITAYVIEYCQYLNSFRHRCYFSASIPRLQDAEGKIYLEKVSQAHSVCGFTLMFDIYIILLIESEIPVCEVADKDKMSITQPKIWRMFDYRIQRAYLEDDLREVTKIGTDETLHKKNNEYITEFVDLHKHKVVFVTEDKGYLWFLFEQVLESGIQSFIKFGDIIKVYWRGIIAYFDKHVTVVLEDINSIIQLAKCYTRGYRNPKNFTNMIYFLCGKLKFDFYYSYKTRENQNYYV
jgi:transposase